MTASIIAKVFLILPLILLIDYVLMIVLGCTSCRIGLGEDFYCGTYCLIGKGILLLSAGVFIFLIFPDLKLLIKHKKNVQTN
jgi:hypothetical protein